MLTLYLFTNKPQSYVSGPVDEGLFITKGKQLCDFTHL